MNTSNQIQQVNSLTYVDVAALNLGLSRLPGESSAAFLQRCYQATTRRRDHSYEGMQDEICLQLGLKQWAGISISSTATDLVIAARIGLVSLATAGQTTNVPTVTMAADSYWVWRNLSDVVADLNKISGITAKLIGSDGPALQIARQSNLFTVVNESITDQHQNLAHGNIIASSLTFNMGTSGYNLTPQSGSLTLNGAVSTGLTVSYQYIGLPYNLVCSELGLFGLTEPSLATVGVSSDNVLAYQLREAVQAVMSADPSYWTE
jgi:hypothetical protein